MSLIMTMFMLLLLLVVSIVVSIAGVLLRLKRGAGGAFRRRGDGSEYDDEPDGNDIRTAAKPRRKGKVFDDDEGEYVDFEEIKD